MTLHIPNRLMYDCNYRYGTSLYAPSVGDIEKNYRNALSKTNLRNDRGDLNMYTFAGSYLHGGTPASIRVSPIRYTSTRGPYNANLYDPLGEGEYVRHYDHLRATTPEPKYRYKPDPYYDLKPDTSYYQTSPIRYSDIDLDDHGPKKVTKTTTRTERWVPLTTHIYHTPYHSYYYYGSPYSSYTYRTADDLYDYTYLDDYKRYTKTTTSRNIDALDLSYSKTSQYSEKCQQIQKQLDEVSTWIREAESKLKSEVVSSRSRMQSELAEISLIVDDTAKYNDELHSVIKKQSKRIGQLGGQSDEINRTLSSISETLEKSRTRCQSMQTDLNTVQSLLTTSVKRVY